MHQKATSPTRALARSTGILLLAYAARLALLGFRSVWDDEAWTWGLLTGQPGVELDMQNTGYYALTWAWTRLVGLSGWTLRYQSLLLGVLAVALLIGLFGSKRRDLGQLAGLLLAVNPYAVRFAQDGRQRMLAVTLVLGVLWLLEKRRYWLHCGLAIVAAWVYGLSTSVVISLGLWFARDTRRRWLVVGYLVAFNVALAWAFLSPRAWLPPGPQPLGLDYIAAQGRHFICGWDCGLFVPLWLIGLLWVIVLGIAAWRRRWMLVLPVVWTAAGVMAITTFWPHVRSEHLIYLLPLLLAALAWTWREKWARWLVILALAGMASGLGHYYWAPAWYRPDWGSAVAFAVERSEETGWPIVGGKYALDRNTLAYHLGRQPARLEEIDSPAWLVARLYEPEDWQVRGRVEFTMVTVYLLGPPADEQTDGATAPYREMANSPPSASVTTASAAQSAGRKAISCR